MFVLALVFATLVGMVSAETTAKSPVVATPESSTASPAAGPTTADPMSPPSLTGESTVAGPTTAGAPAPGKSGATTLKVSSVIGVAAVAGFFFY